MIVLGLPGRNPETESWLESLLAGLDASGREVARYAHWGTDDSPDVAGEARRYPAGTADLVVAKSMGTMVLLASVAEGSLPRAAVLIGTPIRGYSEDQQQGLRTLMAEIPCLFIQQTDDVTGSAAELRSLLGETATIEEVEGADHVYSEVNTLVQLIRNWQEIPDG